ncbi:MAG: hypothetical protein M0006_16470 [Magnetospirillum sp.]|nr:hypothetical protein [Magnetospirillum sp.]
MLKKSATDKNVQARERRLDRPQAPKGPGAGENRDFIQAPSMCDQAGKIRVLGFAELPVQTPGRDEMIEGRARAKFFDAARILDQGLKFKKIRGSDRMIRAPGIVAMVIYLINPNVGQMIVKYFVIRHDTIRRP